MVACSLGPPENTKLEDARRRGEVAGLPSYHIVDNPKYREAFPFSEDDIELIKQHGLTAVAQLRTIGTLPRSEV